MSSPSIVYKELHDVDGRVVTLVEDGDGAITVKARGQDEVSTTKNNSVTTFLRQVFLPEGYPQSVSEDYLSYQVWDTVQAFASSISGSLATKAVLKGVGVGDENATPLAATITWLLRHGAGMVGQIVFTWIQGSDLDYNCKKWRLFADIMNDGAMLLELTAPLWPKWSVQLVLCTSGVARSLVGVAGGATRAAITQHQARANNISDVAAKDGSQETLVNLAALMVNLAVLPWLGEDSFVLTWVLFLLLTILHLFANFSAVRSLRFATLNKQRLLHILREYDRNRRILSIEHANLKEAVIIGFGLREESVLGRRMNLGASILEVLHHKSPSSSFNSDLAQSIVQKVLSQGYACVANRDSVDVVLGSEANLLVAYVDACLLARSGDLTGEESGASGKEALLLLDMLSEKGWQVGHAQLATLGWSECKT